MIQNTHISTFSPATDYPKAPKTQFFAQFKLDGKWWPAGEIGHDNIEECQDFIDIMETSALVSGGEVFEYRIKEEEA